MRKETKQNICIAYTSIDKQKQRLRLRHTDVVEAILREGLEKGTNKRERGADRKIISLADGFR